MEINNNCWNELKICLEDNWHRIFYDKYRSIFILLKEIIIIIDNMVNNCIIYDMELKAVVYEILYHGIIHENKNKKKFVKLSNLEKKENIKLMTIKERVEFTLTELLYQKNVLTKLLSICKSNETLLMSNFVTYNYNKDDIKKHRDIITSELNILFILTDKRVNYFNYLIDLEN